MIKDKNKEVYTSPQTEVLEVRFEGIVCQSLNGDNVIEPGTNDNWGNL